MAHDRTTTPRDPVATALRIAHETIAAFDATTIGRAPAHELLEWIGRFSGTLILLVTAVEKTPLLMGRCAPETATSAMWRPDNARPFRGSPDEIGGGR